MTTKPGLINRSLACSAVLLLLAGCASSSDRERQHGGTTLERIQADLEEARAQNRAAAEASPPGLEDQLMPEFEPSLPEDDRREQRFDVEVDDVPARAFFRGLVDGAPYNMVVHPDVEGRVSFELKDVTVPEVMEVVRRVYGYEYEEQRNGYIVLPARLQSQIFHVDYLNVDRRGQSRTRVSSGEATRMRNGDRDGGSGGRTAEDSSSIETTSRADFWDQLEGTVRSIVGNGEQREVVVDPQAGLVVVRAMPGELRDVGAYLEAAQINLQRQVILETRILEVRLSESHQTGVNWAALGTGSDGTAGAIQTTLVDGQSPVVTSDGAFDPDSVRSTGQIGELDFGGLFAIGAATDDFAALIRLLHTQGDVQVLSSPRVSTVNNQKAVIKVGSDEFFVTDIRSDRDVGATTTTRGLDVELTPFFSGISLDVTPQIGRRGDVTLHVHPAVSEVVDQTKSFTVGGETQTVPLALSSVRESDSVVRAHNGQVVVIGGLMTDESIQRRAQTGWLGDIPILGGLFRQRQGSTRRSELVILMRPVIAEGPMDWDEQIEGMSGRLRDRLGEEAR